MGARDTEEENDGDSSIQNNDSGNDSLLFSIQAAGLKLVSYNTLYFNLNICCKTKGIIGKGCWNFCMLSITHLETISNTITQ